MQKYNVKYRIQERWWIGCATEHKCGFCLIHNQGEKELAMSDLRIQEVDDFDFQNLSGDSALFSYADWRKTVHWAFLCAFYPS